MYPDTFPASPDECRSGPRPCPWIRCEFHPYLIIQDFWRRRNGKRSRYYHLQPWELPHTCVLDVIEHGVTRDGKMTLAAIGDVLGYCRENIRLIEKDAIESFTTRELVLLREAWASDPIRDERPLPAHHALNRLAARSDAAHDGTAWNPV